MLCYILCILAFKICNVHILCYIIYTILYVCYTGQNKVELLHMIQTDTMTEKFIFRHCNILSNLFTNTQNIKNIIEFKLFQTLFTDLYPRLPSNFSFHIYLSKSFEQYALKIMEYSKYNI